MLYFHEHFSRWCLRLFLYGTFAGGLLPTPSAQCPAEIWQFALRHGVQPDPLELLRTPEGALLRQAGIPLLRQGPVRLRYREGPAQAELALLAEAHITLGGARVAVPCARWQTTTTPAARRLLLRSWLNRNYAMRDSLQETSYEDTLLAPFLDSLWHTSP